MAIQVQHLNSNLEPPDFTVVAQALHDATWLDVQVCDAGLLQRVRIEVLHIYHDRETVTVVQHYKTDEGKVGQHRMDVEYEDIMYAVPSSLESVDDVTALVEPESELKPSTQEGFEAVKDAVIMAVAEVTKGDVMGLVKSLAAGGMQLRQDMVDRRHLVLWCLIEMTDHSPASLCHDCGWRSPMPFQSALAKFTGKHADTKWKPVIVKCVQRAKEIGGDDTKGWVRANSDRWKDICVT